VDTNRNDPHRFTFISLTTTILWDTNNLEQIVILEVQLHFGHEDRNVRFQFRENRRATNSLI